MVLEFHQHTLLHISVVRHPDLKQFLCPYNIFLDVFDLVLSWQSQYYYSMKNETNKPAILLWLYHTDMWPEFLGLLEPIKDLANIYIGLYSKNNNRIIVKQALNNLGAVKIAYFNDNCGVDVRPFLYQLQNIDETIFFKLHSKKSFLGFNSQQYINWRSILLNALIGSRETFLNNIELFKDKNVGAVCCEQLILKNLEGSNHDKIKLLCNSFEIDYSKLNKYAFCAGNIFAGRTELYKQYFNDESLNYLDTLLLNECEKVTDVNTGGTFCHALERIFGYINEYNHKQINHPNLFKYQLLNQQAPSGHFDLVITYNQICYIEQNLSMYGKLLDKSDDHMIIQWYHLNQVTYQKYFKVKNNIFSKSR